MEDSDGLKAKRRTNPVSAGLEHTGLYHSFELPDGTLLPGANSLEWQRERLARFGLPEDLTGKRVLDIGPWDGFYTFEMERRGAEVTAIDYTDLDTFRALHRAYGSKAKYLRMEIYELDAATVGTFDIVLCLGVLYHLKHPLLALEKLCAITRDVCVVDTVVIDAEEWRAEGDRGLPYAEFYEYGELAGQLDNWCGPTVGNVEAWIRAAGFARAEVTRVSERSACVLAHRKWGALPKDEAARIVVAGVTSHANRGRSFSSVKEEYLKLWCVWPHEARPQTGELFPEIDGFGAAPLECWITPSGLMVTVRLPPGLAAGRHQIRLKIGAAAWSEPTAFHVDLPGTVVRQTIREIQDGVTWVRGEVDWRNGGWLTVWAEGLSAEADPGNTTVLLAGIPHSPETVDATSGQLNVKLRPLIGAGAHEAVVVHRGASSEPFQFRVVGEPPPIRGLERLARSRE